MINKIIVIKCGGSVIDSTHEANMLCTNILALQANGYHVIVVHGGGPEINKLAALYNLESKFVDGMRVTDLAMIKLTQMALIGTNNTNLVQQLNNAGISAIGLSGHDAKLLIAEYLDFAKYGYVGNICQVNQELLSVLLQNNMTPIIAPLAIDNHGQTLNINADMVAAAIAQAVQAEALILLSDIDGYYANYPDKESLVPSLTTTQVTQLLAHNQVSSGMIPKLQASLLAANNDVATYIINGTTKYHLTQLLDGTKVVGTNVIKGA